VQSSGMQEKYSESFEYRKLYKLTKALAFLPPGHVVYGFTKIQKICSDDFKPVLDYFEQYYIGLPVSISARKAPLFEIGVWNVYDRVVDDLPRTNNSLESWHKVFELSCKKHPTVNKIVEQFRLEQQNTSVLIDQLESGDVYTRNKTNIAEDEAIIQVLLGHKKKSNAFNTLEKLIKII
jgi:hypothetical protein